MYSDLLNALPNVLGLTNLLAVVFGVIAGIVVGAMPGLSATMAISVLVPFTFGLDPLVALGMMAGIYCGGDVWWGDPCGPASHSRHARPPS